MATAIAGKLTINDLSLLQLSYSPPFGAARDVVNVSGLAARNYMDGLVYPVYKFDAPPAAPGNLPVKLLDVRPPDMASKAPVPNSINMFYRDIKSRAKELDPNFEYRTVCNYGKTAYFASRNLIQAGFKSSTLIGGLRVHRKPTTKNTKK
jgi:rhodanese-related sulfurtransferase